MYFMKILRQDICNILHNPTLIFSNTILPLILIGVLGFVTKTSFGKEPVSSFDYYGINMIIFSVGMIAITTTNAFMEEQVKRGNFRIMYAPISKTEIYFSKILSSYFLCAVCYGILVPLCQYILHLNMGGKNIIYFIILLNVFGFCGCCLLSELVSGEYVAYIEICDNGKIEVTSLKSNQDTNAIKTLFETGKLPEDYKSEDDIRNERGIGTNILGFITMLILMQGVALSVLYPEERIKKTLCRVMCSPVSSMSYLSAQFIFTLLCLFIPTYIAICIIHLIFGINIGLSLGIMALLLFLMTLFATSFALFISTMLDRNTNLIATGISIITCILAGCFIPITTNNPVITWILKLIPQTEFMDIVHSIEFGVKFNNFEIFYILLWTFLLLTISITISQKRIQKGNY